MPTLNYIAYDDSTGRISQFFSYSDPSRLHLIEPALLKLEFSGSKDEFANYYVVAGVAQLRPTVSVKLDGSTLELSGLPVGTVVTLTNEAGEVLVVTLLETVLFESPGFYKVQLAPPFPYLGNTSTVEVLA